MTMQIKLDDTKCRPGQLMNASVVWDLGATTSDLMLEVTWQTAGKGTDDSETIFSESWTPDSPSGEKSFQIQLPRGPISVQGGLISIQWQIQFTRKRTKETNTVPFVLSHLEGPVQLVSLP